MAGLCGLGGPGFLLINFVVVCAPSAFLERVWLVSHVPFCLCIVSDGQEEARASILKEF